MKKFSFAFIIAALFFSYSCNNNNDAITLKFNLPKGSAYDYNMNMDMNMKGNVSGQSMDMSNTMGMGYHFAVTGDSAGWKKMQATISRIAMHINAGGMDINYDSDKPGDNTNVVNKTVGNVLSAIKGGQFGFIMNEKGEIGKVTGIDDMMNRVTHSVDAPEASAMASGLGSTFNEDNFKQNIQQAFAIYPDKPVKPGDSWTTTMNTTNASITMKMNNTYTLESVSGNKANIKVNSKITSPEANGNVAVTGGMTGTMQYDIPTGVPLNGNLDINLNMNVNNGGQTMPMTTHIKMDITGKKS